VLVAEIAEHKRLKAMRHYSLPLWDQYQGELKRATRLIRERVEQYTTQIAFEQDRTDEMRQQIERLNSEVEELKDRSELADQ